MVCCPRGNGAQITSFRSDIRSNTKEVSCDDPLPVTNCSSQPSLTWTNDSPEKFTPISSMRGQYSNQTDEFCYEESVDGFSSRVKRSEDEIAEGENSRTPSGRQPDMNFEDANNVPTCSLGFHSPRSIRRTSFTLCSQVTHSEGSSVQPEIGSSRVPCNTPIVREFVLLNIPSRSNCDDGFASKSIEPIQSHDDERTATFSGTNVCSSSSGPVETLPSPPRYMSNRDGKAIDEWFADLSTVPYNSVPHMPASRGRLDRLKDLVKRALNLPFADIRARIVPTFGDPLVERREDSLNCEKSSEI